MAGGYGPVLLDFTPLGNLASNFFEAKDRALTRKLKLSELEAPGEIARLQAESMGQGAQPGTTPLNAMTSGYNTQGKAPTFAGGGNGRTMTMPADPALAPAIKKYAAEAGIDPVDLATAMSYETAGTFDPWKAGPTTKWGQHRGLIQWGEPQAQQYGVAANTPVEQQVAAAVKYLQDRGVKPGMGLMDIYSAINAGSVGRYNASDANNGGAPGTVADKVNNQMSGHRQKAMALLGVNAADVPAPGAQNAQYVIPGQGGQAATPSVPPLQIPAQVQSALRSANPYVRQWATQQVQKYQDAQRQMQMKVWEHGLDQGNKDRSYNLDVEKFNYEKGKPTSGQRELNDALENWQKYQLPDPSDPANREFWQTFSSKALGGAGVNVNIDNGQKGQNKFDETLGAKQADRWNGYIENADAAQTRMADIQQMRELSRRIGSQGSSASGKLIFGPYLEAAGIDVNGLSDIQVYDSLVKRLAPQMRATGSGSTSDVEYKGFVSAIGPLSNNPASREMILDTFEAASRNDLARGEIATRLATGEIDRRQAEIELRKLPDPFTAFREFRKANPDLVGQAIKEGRTSGGASPAGQKPPVRVSTPEEARKLPSGTPILLPDGTVGKVP